MIFNSALSFLLYCNLTSKRQMPESPPESQKPESKQQSQPESWKPESQQDTAGIGIGKGVGIARNRQD